MAKVNSTSGSGMAPPRASALNGQAAALTTRSAAEPSLQQPVWRSPVLLSPVGSRLCPLEPPSRLPRRRRRDITSCRWRARGRKCRCPRPLLLLVSQVTFVRGPGCCFQLGHRYGSPGVLSLAQPQIPVHHCQLRGREGEGQSLVTATQEPTAPGCLGRDPRG